MSRAGWTPDTTTNFRTSTFLVGPPRSALDIAEELEREQAAAKAAADEHTAGSE
jgi:hypothetical protein